jgi:DNA-binding CsgD family transcriptional regulator
VQVEYGQRVLVGREGELRRIAELLDEARRGRSQTLTIVGEPGVGKTALLGEARRRAADLRILTATGVESESELPFASLHELLRPLLGLLPRIPDSQARALSAALALESGEPDALAVGAGTLSLLVEAAEEAPHLILLDDAHWLDSASIDAITFAARRLTGEEIAFLVSLRPDTAPAFERFPRLEIRPLADDKARQLIKLRTEPVPAADESRFLAAAAGNALALLELPVELARELPTTATPYERLSRVFSQRVRGLSDEAQLGLLLAAAESDLSAVNRAAEGLGLDDPLSAGAAVGLVTIASGQVVFRHPVVRSLVYADAPAATRGVAHRALAEALTAEGDRDRHAWHLAAAVEGADEGVAQLLEQTAERAAARGGQIAEARALERAAQLSPDRADGARRLYAASRAAFWAGDAGHALELAEAALPLAHDPLLRADLVVQVGAVGQWRGASVTEVMYLQALDAGGLDDERTGKLLYEVVKLRLDDLDAAGAVELAPRLEAAARGAGPWWGPRQLAGAAAALLVAGEHEHAVALFRELVANPAIPAGFAYDYISLEWYDELRTSLDTTLREGRASGHLLRVAWNQSCAAHLELRLGRLNAAAAAAAEAIPLAETIGTPALAGAASSALAGVYAWRGQADACRAAAHDAIAAAEASGDRYQQALAHQALGLLALGDGRASDTILELEPFARTWVASTVVEPSVVQFVPDLIEAYLVAGGRLEARTLLDQFSTVARAADRTWALAACCRCEGLMADSGEFDAPFEDALDILQGSPLRLELARARLAYGERLRRDGRRRDARVQLRAAHEAFAAVAASPWESRAAGELRATGERVADDESPSLPDLTPQELHIGLLVTQGMTNKEIAVSMFLSPKTVEYHLANTFRKLDIHSRAELARIVAEGGA